MSRTRFRDDREFISPFVDQQAITNGDCTTDTGELTRTPVSPMWTGKYEVMVDTEIENFHSKQAKGAVFINNLHVRKDVRDYTPGGMSFIIPGQGSPCDYREDRATNSLIYHPLWKGQFSDHAVADSINNQSLWTQAGTSAAANVESPEFAGLVTLGEMRETISFLRNPLKAWIELIRGAKRQKNRRKSTRNDLVASFLASNWLSYRYGVRPIVQDVQNAMSALEQLKDVRSSRLTARGFASADSTDSRDLVYEYSSNKFEVNTVTDTKVEVRSGILYEHKSGYYQPLGVNFSQIPITLWELIAFSFVADWFANIGSYIEAITPIAGVQPLASWTTQRVERTSVTTNVLVEMESPRELVSQVPNIENFYTKEIDRWSGTSTGIVFKHLPLSGYLGLSRVTDLVAIAVSLLKSR